MAENRGAGSSYHRAQNQESGQAAYWRYLEGSLSMHEGVSAFERGSQHDKYHTMQGHGFAAEDANALNDIFHGRKVSKVGTSNTKNGADRIVNGVEIQVKYCQSAEATVDSLFDRDGTFRYGKMKVEVPKEQAESVRQQLRERAQAGRLRDSHGNTIRPEQIDDMVQEGSVTYQQAQNIAKAGNLDSLWFDVKNSAISCSCIFGLSFAVNMAQQLWSGADLKDAAIAALKQSFAVGLGSLVVSVFYGRIVLSSIFKVVGCYRRLGQRPGIGDAGDVTAAQLMGKDHQREGPLPLRTAGHAVQPVPAVLAPDLLGAVRERLSRFHNVPPPIRRPRRARLPFSPGGRRPLFL